jgi:DNA-binding NarL/FixJ family response regulator
LRFAEAASLILLRSTGLSHHAADRVHSQASDSGGTVNDESTETPVRVTICAPDPITEAGLTNQVTSQDSLRLVPWSGRAGADVLVFCVGDLAAERGIPTLRRLASEVAKPVVLVVDKIEEADLMSAVACRVVAVLPRVATTGERLAHAVRTAAAGGGMLPPHMLGDLLKHLEHLQREVLDPIGANSAGLTTREIEVLRLMADGYDTAQIAEKMCYSERSVKHIIQGVTQRLNLRNRPHAVAYAVRAGLI